MSETHNTVIVGNKMFRYRKEQHLATATPLDRHELSVNELSRQLAEARGLIAKVKADLISIQDITSDPITSLQLGVCIKKLKE